MALEGPRAWKIGQGLLAPSLSVSSSLAGARIGSIAGPRGSDPSWTIRVGVGAGAGEKAGPWRRDDMRPVRRPREKPRLRADKTPELSATPSLDQSLKSTRIRRPSTVIGFWLFLVVVHGGAPAWTSGLTEICN